MIGTIRLRYRILLGYALIVLLFIAASAAVYRSMRDMERVDAERKRINAARLVAANLESEAFKVQAGTRGLLLTKNEDLMNRWGASVQEVKNLCEVLDRDLRDPKTRVAWTKLYNEIRQAMEFYAVQFNFVKNDQAEKAVERFRTEGVSVGSSLRALFADLDRNQDELYNQASTTAADARASVYRVLVGGSLLTIVLAAIVGIWAIRNASRLIGQTTGAISSSSKEIAATVTQHERTAVAQASMVNETNVTVEELSASSRQSAEQAAIVVETAQRASGLTEEGSSIVGDAIHGMTSLKEKVGSVADQILRLGEQTGQIGSIANVVKDLATQTNMLALNAAVEATRAGEHGKGFAVVAGEVRKLADQSKKSAEEAYRIVSEIQKASNSTIMVTEEGTKTVEEVARIARKVGDLFESLSAEAGRVYENAQQVVLNAKQQSSAVNQIGEAMASINASSKETAAGITQTKTGLQNLEEAARNLQQLV